MQKVASAALQAGARKTERLDVAVLSHSPLLQPVADALTQSLNQIPLNPPRMVYVGNVKARALRRSEDIAWDLANNIAHGVRWYEAMIVLGARFHPVHRNATRPRADRPRQTIHPGR